MKKRTFKIFIQSQNNSSQEHLQMTIKQHNLRDRKRLRTIEDQSEEIILQNNDPDDELTSNQKGLLFEEQWAPSQKPRLRLGLRLEVNLISQKT